MAITSRVREIASEALITDFVALVIEPDAATIQKSYDLAAELMPHGAETVLAPGLLPHITLTQCAVREAARHRVAELIERLAAELRGRAIPLSPIRTFGGGFLFWCVDEESPARRQLQRLHEAAITLSDGLLDPVANAAVVDGTIRLTSNDPVLVANARAHGYAFIRDAYLPHITLGFDPRLIADGSRFERQTRAHSMTIERVVLAKMGPYGQVEAVYSV